MSEDRPVVGRIEQLTVDKTDNLQGFKVDKISELQGLLHVVATDRDSWRRVAKRLDREKYDAQRTLAKLVDALRRDSLLRRAGSPGHNHSATDIVNDEMNPGEPCELCAAWSSALRYLEGVIGK